jgi:Flp pilus assembly protein TadD
MGRRKSHHNSGNAQNREYYFELAIADFCKAIELDPGLILAYVGRGTVYLKLGNFDWAIADFDEAIALGSRDASVYNYRGVAWGNKKNYNKAIADFERAMALDPEDPNSYNNRGAAYFNTGRFDKAIADYRYALTLASAFIAANQNRTLHKTDEMEQLKTSIESNLAVALDLQGQ